jgi:hypothetical protein
LSMLASMPLKTEVSNNSEAEGLIQSSTVRHNLIKSCISCEYLPGMGS